ncbi:MAG: outer membrane protein assembly factor BamA [Epsilonproteobacteria bacterium]|nr:outer membrane protein assembly factor BamA [Campylobacterota bacterium]
MKRVLIGSASLLFTLNAANATEVIKDIKFEGLIHISPAIAKEIIGIKKGSKFDIEKIDKSIKKLFKQKYFKDIWVTDEGGVLTYHFVEKPVIAKVDLVGYSNDKKERMLELIDIHKGDIYDLERIEEAKRRIIKMLEQKGIYDSIVEVKTQKVTEGSVKLEFIVHEGENIIIKKISFFGNKKFDYDDFEPYIANKERQFMGWLWGRNDGKLKVDELKYDYLRIKDVYLKHGFLDAEVSLPFLRTFFEDYSAYLTYKIKEGEQYKVGSFDIEVTEDIPDVNIEEIKEELKTKEGKVFNIDRLRKDIAKIENYFKDKGYAYAKVIPDIRQDKENHTASVLIKVIPGEKVYINDVIISGNMRTRDRIIRREIYLAPGDVFSLTDLKDSINSLRRTGFFSDVKITPRRVSADKIDLLVDVKEAPTGSIVGGIGYGSYDGLLLNASISDRNVFGSGIEVSAEVDYSNKSLKGRLHFYNPRVFDSIYSLGGSVYNQKNEFYDYTEKTKGLNLTVGRKIGRHTHVSLSYVLEQTELYDLSESLKDNPYYEEGKFLKSALIPSIVYNNTDDFYLPRHGFIAGLSAEYAGLGGDDEYIKYFGRFSYFFGLEDYIDYDLILRYKARGGYIQKNGYLPLNEKFYLGGISTVRGYKSGSLAPKNASGDLIGGKRIFSNSIEASIPLMKSNGMRMVFFVDYGMIGEDSYTEIKRSGAGVGIEWLSPMGPMQFFYAKALDDKPEDRTSSFEFIIGRRF